MQVERCLTCLSKCCHEGVLVISVGELHSDQSTWVEQRWSLLQFVILILDVAEDLPRLLHMSADFFFFFQNMYVKYFWFVAFILTVQSQMQCFFNFKDPCYYEALLIQTYKMFLDYVDHVNGMKPTSLNHYRKVVHVNNYKLHQVFYTCHLPPKLYFNVKNIM